MKKISLESSKALLYKRPMRKGNTRVEVVGFTSYLYLFDNLIASFEEDGLYIRNAGWFSNTTKERLNAIPGVSIVQKKGVWYLNGHKWDGGRTNVLGYVVLADLIAQKNYIENN
jgi:hypothetical protein